jgi:hypothetical protein
MLVPAGAPPTPLNAIPFAVIGVTRDCLETSGTDLHTGSLDAASTRARATLRQRSRLYGKLHGVGRGPAGG